jgi:mediator of RNA polymerase II transcription subunit 13
VHGDSTVCASMDIREHPPVRTLTEEYLNEVMKNSQHNLDACDVDADKDEFRDINHNISTQSVILAPFGLSAVLTGVGNKSENFEQNADKIVNDWNTFYPMKKNDASSKLPQIVEVISGIYAQKSINDLIILNNN